jgi:uncharacterized protein
MSIDEQTVRSIFAGLEHGDGDAFFGHVADDVDWTVMGTHPLAGHYPSKRAFEEGTFSKLGKALPGGAQLHVTNVIVAGDMAVVELVSDATARNGMRFDNHYCWGYPLRWGHHSRGARLPRLRDGRRAVPPEPGVSACSSLMAARPSRVPR